ncbi:MAG: zinc-binding dehydrogenase [Pseudomonadales bacterium]|jgi:2-desacetyl-2-hydroxyethyl bacteriochlorophyllide A dehydrogenase|nr:zinc-binding dehydrogenase [Pseudomonadales bacterium]MDP6472319.1 zinc-binding dehydrogenase [Pseudomonadales bacterium]MDP6828115.1 zinc-binding dehydrogenase [Pseudomonadales bacterium]MDP6971813.1 zinc-binding dehydrogenase [Pseudomonadales bacterium]|tara:strand:- start:2921 stop:3922 length:1002 start_codon:yes stop_codon:yes gene_type:complete
MKAAVLHGVRDVRFEQINKPDIGDGEALLRVRACGICGSDLHTYREGLFLDLGTPTETGRVLGHEFAGEIEEINGEVEGLSVGHRVTTVAIGANAEYLKITKSMASFIVPLPDHVSYVEAATTEPLATSLHAVNLADVQDGETIVVMGAGIIGLGVLQCIKARSSARTIVVDLSDKRLALAEDLGADEIVNARNEDVLERVLPGTDSNENFLRGPTGTVDTVFDCVGATANFSGTTVLEQALTMVRQDGKIVVVAVFERSLEIDPNIIVRKGVHLIGSWAWLPDEFLAALDLISSAKIDRKPLISHVFSLEDAAEAYSTQDSADTAVKVMLVP